MELIVYPHIFKSAWNTAQEELFCLSFRLDQAFLLRKQDLMNQDQNIVDMLEQQAIIGSLPLGSITFLVQEANAWEEIRLKAGEFWRCSATPEMQFENDAHYETIFTTGIIH